MSENLKAALRTPTKSVFTDSGLDTAPVAWAPPRSVPEAVRVEAEARVAALGRSLEVMAPLERLEQWLIALGSVVAPSKGAADRDAAEMKIRALASVFADSVPAGVVTATGPEATIRKAAKRFRFFPSAAELSEFFDGEAAALREELRRLRVVAEGGGGKPEAHEDRPVSVEERKAVGALFGDLLAKMQAQAEPKATSTATMPTAKARARVDSYGILPKNTLETKATEGERGSILDEGDEW